MLVSFGAATVDSISFDINPGLIKTPPLPLVTLSVVAKQ